MKKFITNLALTLLILSSSNLSASAYYFATDLEAQVLTLDEDGCEMIVLQHDDKSEEEVFPIGTILKGRFFEYKFKRRLMRDEYVKLHLYEAQLPDGTIQKLNNDIKIKPRVLLSSKHNIQLAGAALGAALKVTVAVWSVGFPVGRGVKAVSDAAYRVYNTPVYESKLKEGTKGFIKGALFPLPEIFLKGEEIAIHDESFLWIQDADEDEKKLTAFVVKRKNLYLSRDKYYDAKGVEAPDYTQYLNEKDMKKYQEKLAKKGVSAKVKQKSEVEVKENVVKETEVEEVTVEEVTEARELREDIKIKEDSNVRSQELTVTPHKHVWQRSYRKTTTTKPKVQFERAQ